MISTPEREAFERGRLPVAPRDRRPALAALALLLILLGALGSALLVFRSGDRESVLAASHDIAFGQVVSRSDFTTVRAAAEGAALVPARLHKELAAHRAAGELCRLNLDGRPWAGRLVFPNRIDRIAVDRL